MGSTRKSAAEKAVEQAEAEERAAAEREASDFDAAAPDVADDGDVNVNGDPEPQVEQKTEAELKREAYSAAESTLRTKYNDEFKQLVKDEATKRGVTYTFRPTPEEKAAAQLEKLYSDFPHLRPA
jgi:hypothetical protein